MMVPKNFYKILYVISDLSETVLRKIDDYKKNLIDNTDLKNKFYNIEFVYMHSIVLDLAKILSVTGSDKSGLKQLKDLCSNRIIRDEINSFEIKYKDTIKKNQI